MFEIKWGKRCFFWELKSLAKRDRVLLTIIWNHKKYHASKNPVKKPKVEDVYPAKGVRVLETAGNILTDGGKGENKEGR